MEQDESTHSKTSGELCKKDLDIPGNDVNVCQHKQWEVNTVNNVTMSDITRAVNAFITHPESSTYGRAFPKKEPVEDLREDLHLHSNVDSVSNNTPGCGSSDTKTYTRDQTEYVVLHHGKVVLPQRVNSRNILEHRSLRTSTICRPVGEELIFSRDSALPTTANESNINVCRNLQTDIYKDNAVAVLKNILPKAVEALNCFKYSMLPSSALKFKIGSNDLGSVPSTSAPNKLSSTIGVITTKPYETRTYETQKNIFCPIKECDLKFSSKRNVDRHVNRDHKLEGFQCLKCGKRFARLSYLEQHDNIHTGIKPYTCKTCGKKFHTHQIMYQHFRGKHTENKLDNKLQCEICGVVGNRSFMSKHTRRVHLKQRYHCTECKEHFRVIRYLKDHMRMHRGEEPYKCALCLKTFVQKHGLLQHLKRHSRALKCPKCDKVFKSKEYLKGHLLQHDGIKKFCCNVCGKTFHHGHYLATHKKSHGEKEFECAICGGKFNRKDNLKSHIMRHQTTGRTDFKKR